MVEAALWLVLAGALVLGVDRLASGVPADGPQADIAMRGSVLEPEAPEPLTRLSPDAHPAIAIVIDDLGEDVAHTRQAMALPSQVALAFLPYPRWTPALAREAGRGGHEVLVHVPMQALGEADPGPMALTTALPRAEILRRLDWALARVPGFVGINNHEGSRFTADADALAPVMARLAERKVFFFDSRTTPDTQIVPMARAYGVSSAGRDVFLDNVATIDAVDASLHALEAKARAQGTAIAIGHPHQITLDAVAYWIAHRDGFALVTLREAMRRKQPLVR
ncbi:MAG TPA: divergent polysaccharide deacetylase family protein [Rhizomicrobium sp.]|nr:divergent polysaccharide deacetylase family protein [Rhizomicrobium sp.]